MNFFRCTTSVLALLAATGCGNEIIQGSGGAGGSGNTSTSTQSTNQSVVASGSTMTSASGMDPCEGHAELDCLGTPQCVPLYDDECCPTCHPGECADCVNFKFQKCVSATNCGAKLECGVLSEEHCNGKTPACDQGYCPSIPGCVEACLPDPATMMCASACRPATAGSCTSLCNSPGPACPPGFTAEQDGTCYTGYCIAAELCGVFKP